MPSAATGWKEIARLRGGAVLRFRGVKEISTIFGGGTVGDKNFSIGIRTQGGIRKRISRRQHFNMLRDKWTRFALKGRERGLTTTAS